eukprot:scaffold7763_cov15-Prasinocladus_malaysianus.AAC.1
MSVAKCQRSLELRNDRTQQPIIGNKHNRCGSFVRGPGSFFPRPLFQKIFRVARRHDSVVRVGPQAVP